MFKVNNKDTRKRERVPRINFSYKHVWMSSYGSFGHLLLKNVILINVSITLDLNALKVNSLKLL